MFTLICENSRGQQINLTKYHDYVVTNIDGLTPPTANINTTKVALGDGAIYNSSVVNERNIVITLYITGDIERNRQRLYSVFKTKQYCKVYYKNQNRNVYTEGYVESFEATIFDKKQMVQISILCPSAYLTNVEQKEYTLDGNTSTINVYNDGDIDTGITIEMRANGTVSNPVLINTQTSEKMAINYSLSSGDVVRITTYRGHKRVYLTHDGTTTNIINRLSSDSTWFTILVGDNIFTYEASSGGSNLDVRFILLEQYEGA